MVKPPIQLRVLQKRLIWFFAFISIIGLGAGYYFKSPLYTVVGLLGLGSGNWRSFADSAGPSAAEIKAGSSRRPDACLTRG